MFGGNSFGSTSFGSTSFSTGFGATPTLNAFGATTQTTTQPAGPIGTTIRFVPLSGTDTIPKSSTSTGPTQVNTRHQNISAMKEYESKSADELRVEDYAANRKVGQPQSAFGSTPFGAMQPSTSQQNTSIFGSTTQQTQSLFGAPAQNQTTNLFGQPKTGFELNNTSNIFNSPLNKPNTTASNSPFNIGTPFNASTSTAGGQTNFPLFSNPAQTNTTPFGTSTVNSPFKTNLFATPSSNAGSIFNTNTNSVTSGFLGSAQSSTPAQPQSAFGTTNSIFGSNAQTSTSAFGATNSLFNTQPKTGFELNSTPGTGIFNTLNKPATSTANASPFQIGTGFNASTSNTGQPQSAFGSTPFGAMQPSTSQQNTSIFGSTTQQTPNIFGVPAQNQTTNLFGQPKTGFELNNTSNIFNSPLNKPNTTASNSPFNIGTPFNASTSTAGGQTNFPLFSNPAQTNTTPFGTSTVNSPFKTNLFATPSSNAGSIFNTNTNSVTSGFLGSAQNPAPAQPQSAFGTTNSLFGNNVQTNTGAFGNNISLFNPQPKTEFELNASGTSIFNTLNKPITTTANTSLFPIGTSFNTSLSNTGGLSTTNKSDIFSVPTTATTTPISVSSTSMFNTSPASLSFLKFTTDPKTIDQYKMKAKTNVKLNKPASNEKPRVNSVLFDGLEDQPSDDMRCAIDVFVPKKNIKKLELKPCSNSTEVDNEDAFLPTKSGRNTSSTITNSKNGANDRQSTPVNRHVRYADNTFPGDGDENSFVTHLTSLSADSSNVSSFHNSSYNRSSASALSQLNSSTTSNRSYINLKCGIINTRPDYRLKPILEEIERCYNSNTETCIINSLLIERPNYGSILFESPLDVKGLNLDEIVHIRRKEVVVYPDDDSKPPIGQGLNKPAIVTLHQVWPVDKSNNEVIKDADRLTLMRYPEKIETVTVEKGARFIEYRPETGSWVFAVKHFSKYGITDDDEEVDQNLITLSRQNQQLAPLSSSRQIQIPSVQQSLHPNSTSLSRPKLTPFCESPNYNNSRPNPKLKVDLSLDDGKPASELSLANQFKMNAKTNLKLNKSVEFEKPKTNSILFDGEDDTSISNLSMRAAIDQLFKEDDELESKANESKRSLTVHGTKRLALQNISPNISVASFDKPIVIGASVPTQRKLRDIKLKPDLYAAINKLTRDITSTCVAGSPKVRFFSGSRKFCFIQGDSVLIHELKLVPSCSAGKLIGQIEERFEKFLDNNSMVTPLNMNPILAPYIETRDFIPDASSHDLLHALYGNLSAKTPYAKQDERLNRVINWLASTNRKLSPPSELYQQIIYHMSCDRYDLSSNLAIESDHPRLALLVATLNLNKDLMFEQLSSWRLNTADQYIDPELLKIYVLLSGLTEWKLSNDVTVHCLKGLKWTQQLCLLALHVTSFVTEPERYGFHMLPLYIKRLDTNTNDVDYHILARHNPAYILSAAESIIDEWFLLESLKSFHVINSESECLNADIIHCNLASQLAPIDLRWACFVALHIINNEVRNQVLIRCLEQNYDQLKELRQDSNKSLTSKTVESWLREKLQIPPEFIDSAKNLAARSIR